MDPTLMVWDDIWRVISMGTYWIPIHFWGVGGGVILSQQIFEYLPWLNQHYGKLKTSWLFLSFLWLKIFWNNRNFFLGLPLFWPLKVGLPWKISNPTWLPMYNYLYCKYLLYYRVSHNIVYTFLLLISRPPKHVEVPSWTFFNSLFRVDFKTI